MSSPSLESCEHVLGEWIRTAKASGMDDRVIRRMITDCMDTFLQRTSISAPPQPTAAAAAAAAAVTIDVAAPARTSSKPVRAYIDGCFDIMHSGHYNAIRQAKQLTDILVVGVHSDAEILRCKGPPVMNEEERLATVKACKWVDEVVFDTPYDPSLELLDRLNCDFCVHGDDTSTTPDGDDAYSRVRNADRLRVVKRTEGVSTTDLVGRLLLMTKRHHLDAASTSPVIKGLDGDLQSLSPAPLSPALMASSPGLVASSSIKRAADDLMAKRDSFSLTAPTHQQPSTPTSTSTPTAAAAAAASESQQVVLELPTTAQSTLSAFLPTAWRISQFSSGRVPGPDDVVVYIDGAFDLFHIGHIDTLKKAKALGTFLYVGLHDDFTVNQHKGKNYPIMNLHERVLNVLSCGYVDEVVMGAPWIVSQDLMNSLNIRWVASGTDTKLISAKEAGPDPYELPKAIDKFKWVETSRNLNTDMVVQRIIDNRRKYVARNKTRTKKEDAYYSKKEYVQEI